MFVLLIKQHNTKVFDFSEAINIQSSLFFLWYSLLTQNKEIYIFLYSIKISIFVFTKIELYCT